MLLLVFWFSTMGYLHVLRIMQAEIRHHMKAKMEEEIPENELAIISFTPGEKIDWVRDDKEFRYQGRMYDIVHRSEKDGLICFHCIDDRQESLLMAQMEKLLKNNVENDNSPVSKSLRVLLSIYPNLFFQEFHQLITVKTFYTLLNGIYLKNTHSGYLMRFIPPPKIG